MVFKPLEPSHTSFSYCKNILDFQLLTMALDISKSSASPCSQGFTPPGSPTSGSATLEATVESLKHLFEKVLYDITIRDSPNNPVLQDRSNSDLDMNRLEESLMKFVRDKYASARPAMATEPDQSFSGSILAREKSQVVEKTDLKAPICTTPDDCKSFRKSASTPKFKKVLEMYAPLKPFHFAIMKN